MATTAGTWVCFGTEHMVRGGESTWIANPSRNHEEVLVSLLGVALVIEFT